jgi:cobaltochelatase CobT
MTLSNRKPGQTKEAPAEPLKRAISGAMKAIARRPEMEIVFAADKPSLVGERARLPEPPRKLTVQDVAILRGHSDSMALRLACHDAAVHRRGAPEGDAARAVYDAVEQSRVECVGSRRMAGMAGNITAMLEDRYHRGGRYEEITDRADAPLEDALALMVRERLTGLKPPKSAEKLVDLWREQIEAKAGGDLDRLASSVEDQRAFSRTVRDMLASLDMAEQSAEGQDDEEDDDSTRSSAPPRPKTSAIDDELETARLRDEVLCDAEESATSSSPICRAWSRASPTGCSAADGAAEPRLGVRPRGGHPRSRAPVAHHHDPHQPLSFMQRRTRRSAIRW